MGYMQRVEHPIRLVLYSRRIRFTEAAAACEYHPAWVEAVINGRVPPSAEFMRRMSAFLDLPVGDLFVQEEEDDEPRPRSAAPKSTRRRLVRTPRGTQP